MRLASSSSPASFTTCSAVSPLRVSIRMSSGPSARKLNPLCAPSSCRLLTPKSASKPSRLRGFNVPRPLENAIGTNSSAGIAAPSSSASASSLARPSAIASGSRSKQISLPELPSLRATASECPPSPSVASTTTPPGRTFRYSSTSSKRTGTCRGCCISSPLPVRPTGGSRNPNPC